MNISTSDFTSYVSCPVVGCNKIYLSQDKLEVNEDGTVVAHKCENVTFSKRCGATLFRKVVLKDGLVAQSVLLSLCYQQA